jgi:hypothetical protein
MLQGQACPDGVLCNFCHFDHALQQPPVLPRNAADPDNYETCATINDQTAIHDKVCIISDGLS